MWRLHLAAAERFERMKLKINYNGVAVSADSRLRVPGQLSVDGARLAPWIDRLVLLPALRLAPLRRPAARLEEGRLLRRDHKWGAPGHPVLPPGDQHPRDQSSDRERRADCHRLPADRGGRRFLVAAAAVTADQVG